MCEESLKYLQLLELMKKMSQEKSKDLQRLQIDLEIATKLNEELSEIIKAKSSCSWFCRNKL